jgi:hypothetical protein
MVLIQNVVQLVCCHQAVTKELVSVAQECYDIADQTTLVCSTIQNKSIQGMIDTTQSISTEMRSIQGDGNNDDHVDQRKKLLDGKLFQKIQQMLDQSKTKQVLQCLDEINQQTQTIQEKAAAMQQSIQRGIDNLPSSMKEEYDKDVIDDTMLDQAIHKNRNTSTINGEVQETDRGMTTMMERDGAPVDMSTLVGPEECDMLQLLNIDDDVQELETTCQRGIMGDNIDGNGRPRLVDLDVLKNLLNGSIIYDQVQQKGIKCQSIMQQMRTLCITVTSLMQSFLTGGCCIQTMAVLANIGNLFRCRNIIHILSKAIQAIQHMIQTLVQVIQKTLQHIQKVIQEFIAAKQIGQFVTNAVQKTKVGQLTSNVVSDLADSKVGDMCTNIVSNIFKGN